MKNLQNFQYFKNSLYVLDFLSIYWTRRSMLYRDPIVSFDHPKLSTAEITYGGPHKFRTDDVWTDSFAR